MLRKIMVPVRGDGKGDNVLRHAATLAERHKAHIEVTHCRARPQDLLPFGVPIPDFLRDQIMEQSAKVADLEEAGLRDELAALAHTLNLVSAPGGRVDGASVSFVEVVGRQVDVIKRHGRLADLIVVAKPDRDRNLGTNTLKAALFHSGRPVLMCPNREDQPPHLGATVALAWNGSAEAARALSQNMAVIKAAESLHILTNGVDSGPGTTVEDLQNYMQLHGVSGATLHRFEAEGSVGAQLLDLAKNCSADMLIMGAYGDSHERETLFGGNTQTIVDGSDIPVLFSH